MSLMKMAYMILDLRAIALHFWQYICLFYMKRFINLPDCGIFILFADNQTNPTVCQDSLLHYIIGHLLILKIME